MFSKMTQGRGDYEEDVDYIPLDALQQVISAIHLSDPESLRPITLAQLSPRVFWSLLYHHRDEMASSGDNSTNPNNIEHAYTTLLPNLNWAFLKKRKLTLSDKAKENLRQQQQQQLGTTEEEENNNDNNNNNIQAAQDAIQAVEDAMDSLHSYDADQRRNNAAQAALARATMMTNHHPTADTATSTTTTTTTTTTWELVTPTEEDKDELIACIGDDYRNNDGTVVDQLLQLQICNWRMLANCTSSNLSKLLQIPETTIDAWLDRAQQESIDEIMVEICNGNVQAVEALRDEAKSGTPKDLANWRMIPDMLLAATPSLQKEVSVPTMAEWCRRSHELLQQYSWVNWYATPVE